MCHPNRLTRAAGARKQLDPRAQAGRRRLAWSVSSSRIFLMAYSCPSNLFLHLKTAPNPPSPSIRSSTKSSLYRDAPTRRRAASSAALCAVPEKPVWSADCSAIDRSNLRCRGGAAVRPEGNGSTRRASTGSWATRRCACEAAYRAHKVPHNVPHGSAGAAAVRGACREESRPPPAACAITFGRPRAPTEMESVASKLVSAGPPAETDSGACDEIYRRRR